MATKYPPAPNIGSQIERALICYFKVCYGDDAAKYGFYFSNDWQKRQAPCVDFLAHKSTETIAHTRNESYMVRLEWKWKGNDVMGENEGAVADWSEINDFVGVGMAGMSVSDNGDPNRIPVIVAADITAAAVAAAQADPDNYKDLESFVCEFVEYKGAQRAESADGTFFIKEIRHFEIRAGNTN